MNKAIFQAGAEVHSAMTADMNMFLHQDDKTWYMQSQLSFFIVMRSHYDPSAHCNMLKMEKITEKREIDRRAGLKHKDYHPDEKTEIMYTRGANGLEACCRQGCS